MGTNEGGVGRFLVVHPAIKNDEYGRPMYDSASEPEATGRSFEQGFALAGGAHFEEAVAAKVSKPNKVFPVVGEGTDLISGAPKQGDQPY